MLQEVMKILPALVTTVAKEAKNSLLELTCWLQSRNGMECFEKSSAVVGAKGMQKIEDDIVEQDRRNVIIRNIPECNYESSMQRRDYNMAKVKDILAVQG